MFKKLFGGGPSEADAADLSIDDLVVLERYDEAEARLKAELRNDPNDLHSHQKLAEVHSALGKTEQAIDGYCHVADEYARDGFYDKGLALLAKAYRLNPLDTTLSERIERLRMAQSMERSRVMAIEGLREGRAVVTAALVVQKLWHHVAPSPLARNLPPEELRRLFSVMELESFPEGTVVERRGSDSQRLLFLVDGTLSAGIEGEGGRWTALRDFGPGDVVGESALLQHQPWPADYRASQAVKALVLNREGLERALVGNPDPRGFLTALRMQHHDRAVISTTEHLRRTEES